MKIKKFTGIAFLTLAFVMLCAIAGADEKGIAINEENFPDEIFRCYVSEEFDSNNDGFLSEEEINDATNIDVDDMGITSLKGIEFFTALTELDCNSNQLTTLDISINTTLTKLYCSDNQLTSLNVGNKPTLTELFCQSNQLTTLNISNSTALNTFVCSNNQFTTLDISNNTALRDLTCDSNQLTH